MIELTNIQATLKAPKSQYNSFGKYKYRNLDDINEAVKPLLLEHECNLVVSDDIVMVGDRFYVKATATITNKDGKSISVTGWAREGLDKKGMDVSQLTGATSSYARKYALNGLFAIDDTKDADSMDNSSNVQQKPKKAFKTKAAKNEYIAQIVGALNDNQPTVISELWMELNRDQQQDLWGEFGSQQQTAIRQALEEAKQ